jgi:hypothetical protein
MHRLILSSSRASFRAQPLRSFPLRGFAISSALLLGAAACSEEDGEPGEGGGDEPSLCPGDFSNREYERSFHVDPNEGLTLMVQNGLGSGPPGGMVMAQAQLTPQATQAVLIFGDSRGPTLQATLMPPQGADGRSLRLTSGGRPLPQLHAEGELVVHNSGAPQTGRLTGKWSDDDFFANASLTRHAGDGGRAPVFTGEFSYHQSLGRGTGLTAGGSLNARFAPGATLLAPRAQQLLWGAFGSWVNARDTSAAFVRFAQAPTPEGALVEQLAVQAWHRASRAVELGANLRASTGHGGGGDAPVMGAGLRMTFHAPDRGPNLAPVLTAHMDSNLVASVSLSSPTAGFSSTFMRTGVSAVLDHKNKDWKFGCSVELYSQ